MEQLLVSELASGYHKKRVLTQVSFEVKAGECIGIVGANGCGKSTLLEILAGMKKQEQGSLLLDQKEITQKQFAALIGYVPQENSLVDEASVLDNLMLWYQNRVTLQDELQTGFLKEIGVSDFLQVTCRKLSGGMKKKVSIACALANKPAILLLDEPCAALDLPSKRQVRAFLRDYVAKGNSVIMATHEEADFAICNRLIRICDGKSEVYQNECEFDEA